MKKWIFISVFVLLSFTVMSFKSSYKKMWTKVELALEEGLPKTGIDQLAEILKRALKEREIGHYFKAQIMLSDLNVNLGEITEVEEIYQLEEWFGKSSSLVEQALLSEILLNAYFEHYINNRYQINNRTEILTTDKSRLADINLWTEAQYRDKIRYLFYRVFKDSNLLLKTSAKELQPYIEINPYGRYFNHDLYHVLFWEVLELTKKLPTSLKEDIDYTHLLLTDALEYYKKNEAARFLIQIEEIEFNTFRDQDLVDKNQAIVSKLDQLIDEFENHELVIEAFVRKAKMLLYNYEEKENYYLPIWLACKQYKDKFPKYQRLAVLDELMQLIELPSCTVDYKNEAHTQENIIHNITYRNINSAKIEVFEINSPEITDLRLIRDPQKFEYRANKRVASIYLDNLQTDDFKTCNKKDLHLSLENEGYYLFKLTTDKSEKPQYKILLVSDVAIIYAKGQTKSNRAEVIAVDALTGYPAEGVEVNVLSGAGKNKKLEKKFIIDSKGRVDWSYDGMTAQALSYEVFKGDLLIDQRSLYVDEYKSKIESQVQVSLFLDRMLYRPGQEVNVKGYAYQVDKKGYKAVSELKDTLKITDNSGLEIASATYETNEFGTFSLVFKLPSRMLVGDCMIRGSRVGAYQTFSVEEYKRPSFTVNFRPIKEAYSSGDTILIEGSVESFSGSLLSQARVQAQLSTNDIKPVPFCFIPLKNEKIIANDEIELEDSGNFAIQIVTSDKSYQSYTLSIQVTSVGGETQTGLKTIFVTDKAYNLIVDNIPPVIEKEKPLEYLVFAYNFDHQKVKAQGRYEVLQRIYKKSTPEKLDTIVVYKGYYETECAQTMDLSNLPVGEYTIQFYGEEKDPISSYDFVLFSENDATIPISIGSWLYVREKTFSEDHAAEFFYGTADSEAYVFMDIYSMDGKILAQEKVYNNEYEAFKIPYKQEYNEGIIVYLHYVKNHIYYSDVVEIVKEQKVADMQLKWTTFRDKIKPGAKEKWTLQILDSIGNPLNAEVLAFMYDASLEALSRGYSSFGLPLYFRNEYPYIYYSIERGLAYEVSIAAIMNNLGSIAIEKILYDKLFRMPRPYRGYGLPITRSSGLIASSAVSHPKLLTDRVAEESVELNEVVNTQESLANDKLPLRSNFNETAFFYPHLTTDKKGQVNIEFTSPEQLTKWSLKILAHTKELQNKVLEEVVYTEKKFSVEPNIPRYLREGDEVILTSVVKNDLNQKQNANIEVILFDPNSDTVYYQSQKTALLNAHSEHSVDFNLLIPENLDMIGVKVLASTAKHSDGEQHLLPILSSKELLIESEPILLIEEGKGSISGQKLFNRESSSAINKKLTIELATNPIWFAIQPMVSVWRSSAESSLHNANKLMASGTALRLLKIYPALFNSAGDSKGLYKDLHTNAELRNLTLQESPWSNWMDSGEDLLDEFKKLVTENTSPIVIEANINKLYQQQTVEGGWSWYEGMGPSFEITLLVGKTLNYIVESYPISKWSVSKVHDMLSRASNYLYNDLKDKKGPVKHISEEHLEAVLLALSNTEIEISEENKQYSKVIIDQLSSMLHKGNLKEKSLALQIAVNLDNNSLANKLGASLKEHLLIKENRGMCFGGPLFDSLPMNQQLEIHIKAMIGLYQWGRDEQLLNAMKLWLATQFQNRQLMNDFAFNSAIYALSEIGESASQTSGSLQLYMGEETIQLDETNPYIKQTVDWEANSDSEIAYSKKGTQTVWGGVYATFEDDITAIESYGSKVKVRTDYFIEKIEKDKKVLIPLVDGATLKVGDIVVSRIAFSIAEDLQFVQIIDARSSSLEPVEVTSGYRYGYLFYGGIQLPSYVSIRDTSTQYFYNQLKKGDYILENRSYVSRRGEYQSGIVRIQSMYAPEITGHSGSYRLEIN